MGEAARRQAHEGERELDAQELAVLALEAEFPRHTPRKDEAIRRRLGLSTTRYYRILGTLVETRAALEHDPVLVARLRRLQQTRADERAARRSLRVAAARPAREDIR